MGRSALVALLVFCGWTSTEAAEPVSALVTRAGNAATDEARLTILRTLEKEPGVDPRVAADCKRLVGEIEKWLSNPKLDYFGKQVLDTDRYDFGIAEDSPLFPLTALYRARMLTWVTLEFGGYWSDPEARRAQFDKIRPLFEQVARAFPENPLIKMYLGTPWRSATAYPPDPAAPAWANSQRESLERLTDIITWWIVHRMRPDGQYGGGWGDDCEMWRWWAPVLVGFADPEIAAAQERFSKALLAQPHMKDGYTSHIFDVEHTSEDSADALTPLMLLEPADDEWRDRALRLADLMQSLWTGVNERGFLQFKSTYFSATEVDPSPKRACDTVYHPRAMQPALLLWQRTGDPRLGKLFTAWMDTWVDAAARESRGKPAGIIPSAIHWPDGDIGGLGPRWWDPENHDKDPLYVWPSAMPLMTQTLLLTYHMTGDQKYLEPLRSMARARQRYLEHPVEDPPPGSEAWCASKLDGLTGVLGKYRLLTGSAEFDDLLKRDGSAYIQYRISGDTAPIAAALERNAAALRINFPGYTSEVRYTDRVLRFPAVFGTNGMFPHAVPGIDAPDTDLLYATVSGDSANPQVCPLNAVRWLTPPRAIAALVTASGPERFEAQLFHFGDVPREMSAQFFLLKPGKYTLQLSSPDARGKAEVISESPFPVGDGAAVFSFTLPPRRLCMLRATPAT